MVKTLSMTVTDEGLRLPAQLFSRLGEVEVIAQGDWVVIKPKQPADSIEDMHARAVASLRAAGLAGLIVKPAWAPPPEVTPEVRAQAARRAGEGPPISRQIIQDRADRA